MSETPSSELTFEQALSELEQIVRDLEDGAISLEDSLARYEKGIGLLRQCHGQLQEAEQRILLLTGVDEAGRPIAQPFAHAASVPMEGSDNKRRRRKTENPESMY